MEREREKVRKIGGREREKGGERNRKENYIRERKIG